MESCDADEDGGDHPCCLVLFFGASKDRTGQDRAGQRAEQHPIEKGRKEGTRCASSSCATCAACSPSQPQMQMQTDTGVVENTSIQPTAGGMDILAEQT